MTNVFLVVGAQRSGTTYLYKLLDEHPQIYMSKPIQPEPKFFCSEEFFKGREYYLDKYFDLDSSHKVYGEKSTSYISHEETPKRIHSMFPEIKLIFVLRNPIQRAISNYWFSVENDLEERSFSYAVKNEEERKENNPMPNFSEHPLEYLGKGKYIDYINRYREYFDLDQMLFIKSEDLYENSKKVIKESYDFLDVDTEFEPSILGEKINSATREKEVLTKDIKDYMIKYYEKPNQKLENLIGINWKPWKRIEG